MKTRLFRQWGGFAFIWFFVLFLVFQPSFLTAATNVVNGDFEAGNSGFSTDYDYVADDPLLQNELYPEGLYSVGYNPRNYHRDFYSTGDHTTGSGLMFIANGSPNTNDIVWQGTTSIALQVGQTYRFSLWVIDLVSASHSQLSFLVNGVTVGTLISPVYFTWTRLTGTFTATNEYPTLTLKNAQPAAAGNDFAIDDINVLLATSVSLTSSPNPSYIGQEVELTAVLSYSSATGVVRFYDGSVFLGQASVVGGVAVLNTSGIGLGNRTLRAEYLGDDMHDPASSTAAHTVLNQPEIDVQRPAGNSIPDGGSIPMGHVLIGEKNLTFRICNLAGAPLVIPAGGVTAANVVNIAFFAVQTGLPLNLEAGNCANLQIAFAVNQPGPFNLELRIANNDADENPYNIQISGTAWPQPRAIFYATPTMGCLDSPIQFENRSTGMTNTWRWDFGDGTTSTERDPLHIYYRPGKYNVTLIASNPAASDTLGYDEMIWIYGYGYVDWESLALVDNSYAFPQEPWENAIDGDVYGWQGTATVEGDPVGANVNQKPPFAIFEFFDKQTKTIDKVRMIADTKIGFNNRWVRNFRVFVSTTGTADGDFRQVLSGVMRDGNWQTFTFSPVAARYIKLVIDQPAAGYRQIGEFQVCPVTKVPAVPPSTMSATSPHKADGADKSVITFTILDQDGKPITGLTNEDFCIWADPKPNKIFPVVETETPGVYRAHLAAFNHGMHRLTAVCRGVLLGTVNIMFAKQPLVKADLAFVQGSQTSKNETWQKAIDGITNGWEGTVTATGSPCYAIFKFADNQTKALQQLNLLTDTGVGYGNRWVTRFRLLASTTGLNEADFTLIYDGTQMTGGWKSHVFPLANVKYLKFVVDFPASGWRQLGEIEVFVTPTPVALQSLNKKAVDNTETVPDQFSIGQCYPNPFNPETRFDVSLPTDCRVAAEVYNVLGRKVRTLVDEQMARGWHTISWDGSDDAGEQLSNGTYFIRVNAGDKLHTLKVLMVK